ncbi:MAG TPA: hypothetical protein VGE00_00080 [Gammaproteobacteria bacterium]
MKMKPKLLTGSLCALLLGAPTLALAAGPEAWDYLSLELVVTGDAEESGFADEDLEGYRLEAAKGLGEFAIVRAASNNYLVEEVLNIDVSTQQLGGGAHFPITTGNVTLDLWGTLNYERFSYAGMVGTGPGIDVGLRAHLSRELELAATIKLASDLDFEAGNDADYTGYTLSAAYRLLPALAIQGSFSNYELDADFFGESFKHEHSNVLGAGVRFYY